MHTLPYYHRNQQPPCPLSQLKTTWGGPSFLIMGTLLRHLRLARGSADSVCLRAHRYLHHAPPRNGTLSSFWLSRISSPLESATLSVPAPLLCVHCLMRTHRTYTLFIVTENVRSHKPPWYAHTPAGHKIVAHHWWSSSRSSCSSSASSSSRSSSSGPPSRATKCWTHARGASLAALPDHEDTKHHCYNGHKVVHHWQWRHCQSLFRAIMIMMKHHCFVPCISGSCHGDLLFCVIIQVTNTMIMA